MITHTIVAVIAAFTVCLFVSPIPEVPTEAYVLPYVIANGLLSWFFSRGSSFTTSFTSLITINAAFILTSTLTTIIRRLYFSPLSRYPGPKLAAVSGLWNANEARLGRTPRTHKALHERFDSDVVRIGPNELSIRNVGAIDQFYGGKYIRGNFSQVFNLQGGQNVASLRDHKIHGAWRRIWGRAFAGSEILRYTQRLHVHTSRTVEKLRRLSGKPVECGHLLDALAFDIILDLAFSQDYGLQKGKGDFKPVELIHNFLGLMQVVGHLPHAQQVLRYLPMDPDGVLFDQIGEGIFAKRQTLKTPREDIFEHLGKPDRETGIKMSNKDIKMHIPITMTVGAHSISTTLTRTFAALASQPDIQARIRQELGDTLGENEVMSSKTLRGARYLEAVVKEGLRMFSPLHGGTPAISPKGGITLDTGDFIPEHTQIWIGQHVMMSDEKYFPRAGEFLPQRWLIQEGSKEGDMTNLVKDKRAWIPFGYGTHACGGRALAMEEMKVTVARIVRDFDISFRQPQFDYDSWADSWKDLFLTVIEKIDLRFVPRTV
ncbi:cytochrome P450 [Macroventuria anomochaeta]|uniref:Cytochrome P450 n=1 Tax=Macroventuria anomochaeta TaxID=301207 RepID=A0ACB6S962_9PLEO|nr:cytochrome P450 [Macroventuria anomochaeta]KAF2630542.1 cytochrome P450 [Macroventuria anomochaeta]